MLWKEYTKRSNVNRCVRYIYTGSLLQAFDKATGGKFISYTCKNGKTKKGNVEVLPGTYFHLSSLSALFCTFATDYLNIYL